MIQRIFNKPQKTDEELAAEALEKRKEEERLKTDFTKQIQQSFEDKGVSFILGDPVIDNPPNFTIWCPKLMLDGKEVIILLTYATLYGDLEIPLAQKKAIESVKENKVIDGALTYFTFGIEIFQVGFKVMQEAQAIVSGMMKVQYIIVKDQRIQALLSVFLRDLDKEARKDTRIAESSIESSANGLIGKLFQAKPNNSNEVRRIGNEM